MRITGADIHPRLGAAYEARVREFTSRTASSSVEPSDVFEVHRAVEELLKGDHVGVAVGMVLGGLDIAALLAGFLGMSAADSFRNYDWILVLWTVTIALNMRVIHWVSRRDSERRYSPEMIRLILPLVATRAAEKRYVRALLELMQKNSPLGEAASRELLRNLNALLESGYEIAEQQERIGSAMVESGAELEVMRADLTARIAAAMDGETREILQQSLAICDARLERARTLAPLQARLEAQQERIVQTIASVGEALAGLKVAPSAVTTPSLEAVQETVERIQGQTKSVERAVQEVMALRVGNI